MPLDSYGLGPERSYSEITFEEFHNVCNQYGPTQITVDTSENLEDLRLHTIPGTIQQRKAAGCAFMEKVELQILGEYRRKQPPGLLIKPMARAIASNSIEDVRENTRQAYLIYGERRNYIDAINKLMELKGVSFAIATLMLHELDPVNVPYFTDALYRWVREDEARDGSWDRRVDFIFKHYHILIEKVAELRGRLRRESGVDVSSLEVEQVARELTAYAMQRRKRNRDEEEDDFMLRPVEKKEKKRLGPPKPVAEPQVGEANPVPAGSPGAVRNPSLAESASPAANSDGGVDNSMKPRKKRGRPPLPRVTAPNVPPSSSTPAASTSASAPTSAAAAPLPTVSQPMPGFPLLAARPPVPTPPPVAASTPISAIPSGLIPQNTATPMPIPDAHAAMRDALLAFQRTS